MPRPGSGSMGHAKHRKKGTPPKNGKFKQARMRDANPPEKFTRKSEMTSSIKDLIKEK